MQQENVISVENNGSYIMGYEDGVGTRSLLYDELAISFGKKREEIADYVLSLIG